MTRHALVLLGAAAIFAGPGIFFLTHGDANAERCFAEHGEAAVAACTAAIESGKFSGPDLAAIYDNRAIELRQQGDYDEAIADYSEALRHDAGLTGAYTGRGLAYEGANQIAKAKMDYRAALAVGAKRADGEWAEQTARGRLAALGLD
ncbi:MAG TPA: tetratricopeptide repeat protein [Xanthobacteraceae bacterium]|nr:tetratricopeptide repeat protein [Xanthobacteraceae bacterium]